MRRGADDDDDCCSAQIGGDAVPPLECTFRDVTYETLNEEGFREALRNAFLYVEWDKPFAEFETAKTEGSPTSESSL